MKRTMEEVREQFEKMKELWEKGWPVTDIAEACETNISTVLNTFNIMGVSFKKEDTKKLVYADNSVNLEKVVINGKRYTDITPIFSPR